MKDKARTVSGNKKDIKTVSDDVSLKMFTVKALNSSDAERYRDFLENIQEEYFELDLSGNFTFFNNSVCRVLGYSAEELLGMNYRHYTANQETEKEVFQAFNKVYKSEEPLKEYIWQITRKDGSKRHIEGSLSLKKRFIGKINGI